MKLKHALATLSPKNLYAREYYNQHTQSLAFTVVLGDRVRLVEMFRYNVKTGHLGVSVGVRTTDGRWI